MTFCVNTNPENVLKFVGKKKRNSFKLFQLDCDSFNDSAERRHQEHFDSDIALEWESSLIDIFSFATYSITPWENTCWIRKNTRSVRPCFQESRCFWAPKNQKIKIFHVDPKVLLSFFNFLSVFPNNFKASAKLKWPPQRGNFWIYMEDFNFWIFCSKAFQF